MTVIQNTVRDPAGRAVAGAAVRIRLIAGDAPGTPGYTSTGTVLGAYTATAGLDGTWSVDLPANTTITPDDTYYQVAEHTPGQAAGYVSYIEVPSAGGPYQLSSILLADPTPPAGLQPIDAPLQRDVLEAETVRLDRAELVDAGTAADMFACYHAGNRTGYHNEYGELRSVSAKNSTVPLRVRRRTSSQSANIFEVCDESNSPFFAIGPTGAMITATPVWTAPSFGTNITDAGSPYYGAASRAEPLYGTIRLRGRLNAGGTINSGVTLATITAAHRPASEVVFGIRTGGVGAAGTFLTVTTGGLVSVGTGLSSGSWVQLDGITWNLTA